jgi:hypothetical protein
MTGNFLVVGPHKGDKTIAVPPRDEIIIAAQKYWGKAERVDVDSFTILIWSTDVTIDSQEVPPTLARRLAR